MKKLKLAALVSAFAVSLSAFADATSWFDGKIETGWPTVTGMNGAWSENATDLATFQEAVPDGSAARLELDAGDSVLDFTATQLKDLAAGTESVTYTTKVQFYPFSAVPETLDSEAKAGVIAVYDEACMDNVFYAVAADGGVNAWVQLMDGQEPVFASSTIAYTLTVTIAPKETGVLSVTYAIEGGDVNYQTTVDVLSESTATGKACYSGSGYIESLSATAVAATKTFTIDQTALAAAHLSVVSVAGATGEDPYTVAYGDEVTITFAALPGYSLSGTTTATYAYADIGAAISTFGDVAVDDVAQIDEMKYQSFAEAVAAVQDGETITLLKATETLATDYLLIEKNNVVLDLGGFELTLPNVAAFKFGVSAGKTITVQNGTITMTAGSYGFHVGTNAVANISCAMEKKSASNPVIDIYGGTVNCGSQTTLTGAYDIFRFKDTNLESTVNITGGTYTMTGTSIGMFHHYKAGHTANINISGGDFTFAKYLIDAEAEDGKTEPTLAFTKLAVGNAARFSGVTLAKPESNKVIIGGVSKNLEDADLLADNCELVEDDVRTGWYKVAEKAPQGFSVIITYTQLLDSGISGYKVSINGGTASEEYAETKTFEGITTSLQIIPILADWYKAQYNGADGEGLYTEAAEVTLTAAQIPATDVEDDTKTVAEVAAEVGLTVAAVENLAPEGATAAEQKAKLAKAMTWARTYHKSVSDVAAFNFDEPGQTEEAYLLGVAVDDDAIQNAKDNFKFPAITPGTTPEVAGTANFNGTVTVQGSDDLKDWGAADGKKFFKATLTR